MSDRSSWAMLAMFVSGIASLLLFTCTPRNVYNVEHAEYTAEDNIAIAQLVVTKMDAEGLYNQYKAKTLPGLKIHSYISKVESSVIKELELARDVQVIGETPPWIGWMFAAGTSVFFFAMLVCFTMADSRVWRAMACYWSAKGDLKRELNKEQVKTLKEIVKHQNMIEGV